MSADAIGEHTHAFIYFTALALQDCFSMDMWVRESRRCVSYEYFKQEGFVRTLAMRRVRDCSVIMNVFYTEIWEIPD